MLTVNVLADRTAARNMIGYWRDTVVCLSVCVRNQVYCELRLSISTSATEVFLAHTGAIQIRLLLLLFNQSINQ